VAALASLAAPHEDASGGRVEVAFGEIERLADAQPGAPEKDDQRAGAQAVDGGAGVAHDRDDLFDRRRVRRIAAALVTRRTACVMTGHRGRRARAPGRIEQRCSRHTASLPRRVNGGVADTSERRKQPLRKVPRMEVVRVADLRDRVFLHPTQALAACEPEAMTMH
jgi:hypothetical protein